jgi:hypothetical protein
MSQTSRAERERNAKLVELANYLDRAREKINTNHARQMNRLYKQAVKLNALQDANYRNAKLAAVDVKKKSIAKLNGLSNKLVKELSRNYESTKTRRNLYTRGIAQRTGAVNPQWQHWTNKLWNATEGKKRVEKFMTPTPGRRAPSPKRGSIWAPHPVPGVNSGFLGRLNTLLRKQTNKTSPKR